MLYYQRYSLFRKEYRESVSLEDFSKPILDAIDLYFPDSTNHIVTSYDFSFENPTKPERGRVGQMSQYISHTSDLNRCVVQYDSKCGHYPPSRKLFMRVEDNYDEFDLPVPSYFYED